MMTAFIGTQLSVLLLTFVVGMSLVIHFLAFRWIRIQGKRIDLAHKRLDIANERIEMLDGRCDLLNTRCDNITSRVDRICGIGVTPKSIH